ncbi:hypothetical protein F4806DRAFT_497666 [Annulohypoxylon nitens]|nr:hypothetical protein F4806DRAFT_497666 [Annulohypoxylon nitens]
MSEELALCVPPSSPKTVNEPGLTIIITEPSLRSEMSDETVDEVPGLLRPGHRRRSVRLPPNNQVSESLRRRTLEFASLNERMMANSAAHNLNGNAGKPSKAAATNDEKQNKKGGLQVPFRLPFERKRSDPAHGPEPRREAKPQAQTAARSHSQRQHTSQKNTRSRSHEKENKPEQQKRGPKSRPSPIEIPSPIRDIELIRGTDRAIHRASGEFTHWDNDSELYNWQRALVRKLVHAKYAQLDQTQNPFLRTLRHCAQIERLELAYRTCELRLQQYEAREKKAALREKAEETYHDRALDEEIQMWRERGSALVRMDLERRERERRERGSDYGLLRAMSS